MSKNSTGSSLSALSLALSLTVTGLLPPTAVNAQVAGFKPGACADWMMFPRGHLPLAAALATLDPADHRLLNLIGSDPVTTGQMRECGATIRRAICTDGFLPGTNALKEFAIGAGGGFLIYKALGRDSVIGGLLTSGAAGLAYGAYQAGKCKDKLAAAGQTARAAYAGWQLNLSNPNDDGREVVRARLAEAVRSRQIDAPSADALFSLTGQIATRLEQRR